MTGPEHYRKAEEITEVVDGSVDISRKDEAMLLGLAQVHATLALTVATVNGYHSAGAPMDWTEVLS